MNRRDIINRQAPSERSGCSKVVIAQDCLAKLVFSTVSNGPSHMDIEYSIFKRHVFEVIDYVLCHSSAPHPQSLPPRQSKRSSPVHTPPSDNSSNPYLVSCLPLTQPDCSSASMPDCPALDFRWISWARFFKKV